MPAPIHLVREPRMHRLTELRMHTFTIAIVNTVKGLEAEFLDTMRLNHHCLLVGMHWWRNVFSPCLVVSPTIFFEFDKGVCSVRHLADTPDSEAWSVNLCANLDDCRKGVLIELLAQLILLQWFSTTWNFRGTRERFSRKENCIHFKRIFQCSKWQTVLLPCSTWHT